MKLDIGAGKYRRDEDYTTVDFYDDGADIKALCWAIPVDDNSVDAIWAAHVLEHISMGRVAETLKEWHRILKSGRVAIIQVPNFDYVAKYWLTGADRTWAEQMIFGLQTNEGEFHRSAFTAAILRADCEAAGFEVKRVELRWTHNQETLQAVCRKPEGAPRADV